VGDGAGRRLGGPPAAGDRVTDLRLTLGGATALITVDGWHLPTDPTCDDPGRRDAFGRGTSSRKLAGPAIAAFEGAHPAAMLGPE
jgi:hypothetical protein